jgi:hypothetical protein
VCAVAAAYVAPGGHGFSHASSFHRSAGKGLAVDRMCQTAQRK